MVPSIEVPASLAVADGVGAGFVGAGELHALSTVTTATAAAAAQTLSREIRRYMLSRLGRLARASDLVRVTFRPGTGYSGAIGGQSAGSLTTRIGDPAR